MTKWTSLLNDVFALTMSLSMPFPMVMVAGHYRQHLQSYLGLPSSPRRLASREDAGIQLLSVPRLAEHLGLPEVGSA